MDETRIHGIIPGLPTPLTDDRRVDGPALQKLVRHVVDGGVHGLYLHGSISESVALNPEERREIVQICVDEVAGTIPVMVGIGNNDLRQVVANAEEAKALGADICSLVSPHYFILTEAEAIAFFEQTADYSPLPILIYNNAFSTNLKLSAKALVQLSAHPNIIGVKDSTADFILFQEFYFHLGHQPAWRLIVGDDRLVAAGLLMGGHGAVVAWANIYPELFVRLYDAARNGDIRTAFDLQKRICVLEKIFEVQGPATDGAFLSGVKAVLEIIGVGGRQVTAPFERIPDKLMPEIERLLKECRDA